MKCPYCQHAETGVVDSRPNSDSTAIRRRRECTKCSKRFTTSERLEMLDLSIIKKDGSIETFDRNKVIKGILKACEKRPVKREKIEFIADAVETQLRQMDKTEIPSRLVGELVMERLRKLDEVAYVRFASVYKKFRDASQFAEEVAKLKNRTTPNGNGGKARKTAVV
ncbi:MAG: transcriptional regulator NrdR [Candidatus Woesearchaeota archaeon]